MEKGEHGAGGGKRAVLRCICGHRILCEVHPEADGMGLLVFFDGESKSETHGRRVRRCPGCGKLLGLPVLRRESRPV